MKKTITRSDGFSGFFFFTNNLTFDKLICYEDLRFFFSENEKISGVYPYKYPLSCFVSNQSFPFSFFYLKKPQSVIKDYKKKKVFREFSPYFFSNQKTRYLKTKFDLFVARDRKILILEISDDIEYKSVVKFVTVLFSMNLKCVFVRSKLRFFLKINLRNTSFFTTKVFAERFLKYFGF